MGSQCSSSAQPHLEDAVNAAPSDDPLVEERQPFDIVLPAAFEPLGIPDQGVQRSTSSDAPPATHESAGSYAPPSAVNALIGDALCVICLEPLQGRAQTITVCGHIFHRGCINSYGKSTCPQCRHPIDNDNGTGAHDSLQTNPPGRLAVGTMVLTHGLRTHAELNNLRGRIVAGLSQGRYEVQAQGTGQLYRVREENLVPAPSDDEPLIASGGESRVTSQAVSSSSSTSSFGDIDDLRLADGQNVPRGTRLELVGLQNAHQYNGHIVEVLSSDSARSRLNVRLVDGSVKTVRYANARLVESTPSAPSTQARVSPRECEQGPRSARTMSVNAWVAQAQRSRPEGVNTTSPEFIAYARYLSLDVTQDKDLFWIAEESLSAPLPMEWTKHHDSADRVFYYNIQTRTSSWTHPLEHLHRDTYKEIVACRSQGACTPEQRARRLEKLRQSVDEAEREAAEEIDSWTEHTNEQGRVFYHCAERRMSTWSDPRLVLSHKMHLRSKALRVVSKRCTL